VLSERLFAIAGFVEKGACVADVGTDHGYLPVYLAQNGLASHIIASDISAGSLRSALITAEKYGVADKISFVVAPGLSGIGDSDVDTIVLSGLGGETICHILADAGKIFYGGARIILQPQTKTGLLCSWLLDNGYALQDAKLARDKGRIYVVMLAGKGATRLRGKRKEERGKLGSGTPEREFLSSILNSSEPDRELLNLLAGNGDPLFPDYIAGLISQARRAADGMARSGAFEYPLMARRLEYLSMFQKPGGY